MAEVAQIVDRSKSRLQILMMKTVGTFVHPAYRLVYSARRRNLLLRRKAVDKIKVIAVGNISLGGAGKTPFTSTLWKLLLARGYRGGVVVKLGKKREAFLDEFVIYLVELARSVGLGKLRVVAEEGFLAVFSEEGFVAGGRNKIQALERAKELSHYDFALIDDAYQLFTLKPDLNICLVRREELGYRTFPSGLLREEVSAIERADLALFRSETLETKTDEIEGVLRNVPTYNFCLRPAGIFSVKELLRPFLEETGSDNEAEAELPGGSALIFSGIAGAAEFEHFARLMHSDVPIAYRFNDHHQYSLRELKEILWVGKIRGCSFFITTEKDAARLLPHYLKGKVASGERTNFPEPLYPRTVITTPEFTLELEKLFEKLHYLKVFTQIPEEVVARVEGIL